MVDVELVDLARLDVGGREGEGEIPRDGLAPRIGHVESGGAREGEHGRRGVGVVRHHLDDEADLVRAYLLHRLEAAHDTVAAVDVEEEAVAVGIGLGHALADILEVGVDLGDENRIAHARDGQGAIAHPPDPFELEGVGGGLDVARAAHPHLARIDLLEGGFREIDGPSGQVEQIRIRLLVEGVGGHRRHRAHLVGVGRLHDERALLHEAEQAVGAVARIGGGAAALEDLPHVNDQPGVEARAHGQGADGRRVIGPPGDDDLRLHVEGAHEGLVAHLGHDAHALVHVRRGERRVEIER